jgi:hypothetical protein
MGTRSRIAIKTPEGKYRSIYCHWDGYLSHNGKILLENYQDVDKINRLIDLGDISSLNEEVEPTEAHSYDKPQKGVVIAYGRDRGETDVEFRTHDTLEDIKKHFEEYNYVWDNGWHLVGRDLGLTDLKNCKEDEDEDED